MKTYLCSYKFREDRYSIEIPADTQAEAYLRLQAIGSTGQVDGELMMTIAPFGWLDRLLARWKR